MILAFKFGWMLALFAIFLAVIFVSAVAGVISDAIEHVQIMREYRRKNGPHPLDR